MLLLISVRDTLLDQTSLALLRDPANHRLQRRPRVDGFEVVNLSRGPAEPKR